MNLVERLHERYILGRRVTALGRAVASFLPMGAEVLDVGCGDGRLAEVVLRARPDVVISGLEVQVRNDARMPVQAYDGITLPYARATFDVVMFVDVLHHTRHAEHLLREARRVARRAIVLKDHCADGVLAWPTLRFMDHIGNARFGVDLPHSYLRWSEWTRLFERLELTMVHVHRRLGLYPPPLSWLFDRSLHFIALLESTDST